MGTIVRAPHAPTERRPVPWRHPALYEWWFRATPIGRASRAVEKAAVVELLAEAARPHHHALELGPGTGTYTIAAARRVRGLVAVEPAEAMREYLGRRLRREGHRHVTVREGRIPDQIPGEGYDGALAVGVLDFLPDLVGALRALAAAVRPGGWVIVTTPAATPAGRLARLTARVQGRRVDLRSAGQLDRAARDAGLLLLRLTTAGVLPGGRTLVAYARVMGEREAPRAPTPPDPARPGAARSRPSVR